MEICRCNFKFLVTCLCMFLSAFMSIVPSTLTLSVGRFKMARKHVWIWLRFLIWRHKRPCGSGLKYFQASVEFALAFSDSLAVFFCHGQPLDCVKTKMQAQVGLSFCCLTSFSPTSSFLRVNISLSDCLSLQVEYQKMGMTKTFVHVVKTEGTIGLFRGLLPPLLGSSIFRSVQFGVRIRFLLQLDLQGTLGALCAPS